MSSRTAVKIRAFKAFNNDILCDAFIAGHRKVLSSYNVPKITSDSNEWRNNKDVFVISVETTEGEVVGGARIHIKNKDFFLPIEDAFYDKYNDFKVWMKKFDNVRIGEICGLWNAKSIAGSGVSLLLIQSGIAKSGIVITNQLKLNTLICLCAPWTVSFGKDFGFSIPTEIGENGSYPYPKPDLPATIMYLEDTEHLKYAQDDQRTSVFSLRNTPIQKKIEQKNGAMLEVNYDLLIPNLNI